MNDKTVYIEEKISNEKESKFIFIVKLFKYVFSSAKLMCSLFLGLSILLSLTRPIIPLIWKQYIDSAYEFSNSQNITIMIILVSSYYLLKILEQLLWRYTQAYEDIERLDHVQRNRFQELIDTKIYKKLASLSPEYLEVPKINDTINRVFGFTSVAWDGLNRAVMVQGYMIIAKTISILSIAVALYVIEPILTFIIILAAIPTIYTTYVGEKIVFKFREENSNLERQAQYFQDLLVKEAPKEIKSLGLFDFFYKKWKEKSDDFFLKEKKIYLRQTLIYSLNDFIQVLATMSTKVFAIVLMAKGLISIGTLAAVLVLIDGLSSDIHTLFKAVGTFISKKNECTLFFSLMELDEQKDTGINLEEIEEINAKNLSYRYPLTDNYVLNDVNLTIKKGEKVAFVGENGAGKTTFVKLVSGMIHPSNGELEINDVSVENINPINHYHHLSAVFQEPSKYTTFTISDNVFLADTKKERNDEEIERSLELAGLFVEDKEQLLGKDVGGTELSGGQWQKLAIARAYYRNRDFIILDEPTSNLDPIAEAEIFKKYIEMSKGKTVIMVTHRISVAALADRIIVFDKGKVVEDGTHEQLSNLNGVYANLYKSQAEWYNR